MTEADREFVRQLQAKLTPDLLKPKFREVNTTNPMAGHCYVATEACYHPLGGASRWHIRRGKSDNGVNHWWLVSKSDGEIRDPTEDQFNSIGKTPPYSVGVGAAFLTSYPSRRAKTLMQRIGVIP